VGAQSSCLNYLTSARKKTTLACLTFCLFGISSLQGLQSAGQDLVSLFDIIFMKILVRSVNFILVIQGNKLSCHEKFLSEEGLCFFRQ